MNTYQAKLQQSSANWRLHFHYDGGHGWLEVPLDELRKRGLTERVSEYSYIHDNVAYLEEDCDAAIFIAALRAEGKVLELKEINDGDESPIRSYARFQS